MGNQDFPNVVAEKRLKAVQFTTEGPKTLISFFFDFAEDNHTITFSNDIEKHRLIQRLQSLVDLMRA